MPPLGITTPDSSVMWRKKSAMQLGGKKNIKMMYTLCLQ